MCCSGAIVSTRVFFCFVVNSASGADLQELHSRLKAVSVDDVSLSPSSAPPTLPPPSSATQTSVPDTEPTATQEATTPVEGGAEAEPQKTVADGGDGGSSGGDGGKDDAGSGRMETDAQQVLHTVTEKLKELYPTEALDAHWLQVCCFVISL